MIRFHVYDHIDENQRCVEIYTSEFVYTHEVYVYVYGHIDENQRCAETVGAGVEIHTVDTLFSLFQFRTHFLVRFVPNKLTEVRE